MARDYENSVGPGWRSIVAPLIAYCKANGVKILQIKEKLAQLRFYYGSFPDCYLGGDKTLDKLIDAAEELAAQTCEWCGAPGTKTNGGWIKTLCPEHTERYKNGERWWLTPTGHSIKDCEPMPHYEHTCSRGTKSCVRIH